MKILKPTKKAETVKAANKKQAARKLPPDTYKPLFDGVDVEVDDSRKLIINVQRGGEEGLPCVDVRTYQTTEAYTGYTKKGINIPLNLLPHLIAQLERVSEMCEDKKLYDEYEEE